MIKYDVLKQGDHSDLETWKPGKVRELKKVREKSGKMKKSGKSQGIHVGPVCKNYFWPSNSFD